jgi:hypothetical protein
VNRNDNIGLEGFNAFSDSFATKQGRMGIGAEFIQFVVGKMVEQFPLPRVRRQMFVGIDKSSVG